LHQLSVVVIHFGCPRRTHLAAFGGAGYSPSRFRKSRDGRSAAFRRRRTHLRPPDNLDRTAIRPRRRTLSRRQNHAPCQSASHQFPRLRRPSCAPALQGMDRELPCFGDSASPSFSARSIAFRSASAQVGPLFADSAPGRDWLFISSVCSTLGRFSVRQRTCPARGSNETRQTRRASSAVKATCCRYAAFCLAAILWNVEFKTS
jgi:hypothetical protein